MICPACAVQMNQKIVTEGNIGNLGFNPPAVQPIGGGESTEERYITWELKECPACSRQVLEYYAAIPVENAAQAYDRAEAMAGVARLKITE